MIQQITLPNIIDEIVADDMSFYSEDEMVELYETCIHLICAFVDENHDLISDPDFHDLLEEDLYDLIFAQFEEAILFEVAEDEICDTVECALSDYFSYASPSRSYGVTAILNPVEHDIVGEKLDLLRAKIQPPQRTEEWYVMRYNLITASNAYKAMESQAVKNQLIYEKCVPRQTCAIDQETGILATAAVRPVNINTSLHWGNKYEELSAMVYETKYNTKIEEFGCIIHNKHLYLGASPDGINVDKSSDRYGRMLEIKNIVNREITGIPKKEYWVQMQMQMEVCDLNECDFLETRFTEYEDEAQFLKDESKHIDDMDNLKGIMLYFDKNGVPKYVYKPFEITDDVAIDKWVEDTIGLYQNKDDDKYNYVWIRTIYWKLDCCSCVLVLRNSAWFERIVCELKNLWDIVIYERENGYEHRAPSKQNRQTAIQSTDNDNNDNTIKGEGVCKINVKRGILPYFQIIKND